MKNELSRCEALWWQHFCWEPPFSYFLQHTRLLLGQHGQTCLSVISAEGQEPDLIQLFLPAEDQEEEMGVNDSGRYLWRSHFYSFSYLDVIQMTTAPARSSLKHEPLMASTPPVGLMPGAVCGRRRSPELLRMCRRELGAVCPGCRELPSCGGAARGSDGITRATSSGTPGVNERSWPRDSRERGDLSHSEGTTTPQPQQSCYHPSLARSFRCFSRLEN